ncbi:MAG: oxidoreductase [Deltaproteobacteria bacterium CG03_land_8_20_14_0_80_45_14]|nr:MAG: oxidoreductase [Deltaproteobacteria bacterium CG03_land_8_20_14_0_80_45_14]
MKSLEGKVVIITGASSGIGAALAKAFSQREARVVLTARRLEKLKEAARNCPNETLCVRSDVTNVKDRQDLINQTLSQWNRVDILVNNAGSGMYGKLESIKEREIRNLFEVNILSIIFLTQMVLPIMKSQGEGLIVNISSIAGLVSHSNNVAPYISTKHAVIGFSRGLVKDLQGTKIKVNVVCPYLTLTEFFDASVGTQEMSGIVEQLRSRMDSPDQVAKGILNQIFSDRFIIFPTEISEKAYFKFRDL